VTTVPARKIQIAKDYGLENVDALATVAAMVPVPFAVACALIEKESMGRNVYGHDVGGVFSDLPATFEVNEGNFQIFEYYVVAKGHTSNGVGPCQITYRGFFPQMREERLCAWVPRDNMLFGMRLIKSLKTTYGSWEAAGTHYNGSATYGADFAKKIAEWKGRFE
jgi:hypothetical protein